MRRSPSKSNGNSRGEPICRIHYSCATIVPGRAFPPRGQILSPSLASPSSRLSLFVAFERALQPLLEQGRGVVPREAGTRRQGSVGEGPPLGVRQGADLDH